MRERQEGDCIDECVVPIVKHDDESVVVWECFVGEMSGDFITVKEIMKKKQYHSFLKWHAIPSGLCIIGKKNHLSRRQWSKTLF